MWWSCVIKQISKAVNASVEDVKTSSLQTEQMENSEQDIENTEVLLT